MKTLLAPRHDTPHDSPPARRHLLVIRDAGSSWAAKLVAVEFEAIYAVSHPGWTRLYGFGIFGGSNGFWRTDVLARSRMHGTMLTEDIDSTLRALPEGARSHRHLPGTGTDNAEVSVESAVPLGPGLA